MVREAERTVSSIIEWFVDTVGSKLPIAPHLWCEAGACLNVLRSEEDDLVFDFQQKVAKRKVDLIDLGKSVAQAKTMVEASDEYREFCKQKAKCERITEFIRLSKIMSKLRNDEYQGN